MSHSLPGTNLFYLPEDNLAPEAYERIISPFFAWSHIEDEYDFDDDHDDGFSLVGMHEKPAYRSPNLPRAHGLHEKSRLKSMLQCGEVVMLSPLPGPAGLFYIDDNGALICTHRGAFELSGADGVIREYQRSVARRDYRNRGGKPRPTVRERRRPVPEPEPYIPAAGKKVAENRPATAVKTSLCDDECNDALNIKLNNKKLVGKEFVKFVFDEAKKNEVTSHVPAAITTAQAILETGYGKSVPVDIYSGEYSNNLFGIKAHGNSNFVWVNTHEYVNGVKTAVVDKFMKYDSYEGSIAGRSDFFIKNKRYHFLFDYNDPCDWARGLQKARYATDPNYANKLISIMKKESLL